MLSRRSFVSGLIAALAAPAIVRATSLMPLHGVPLSPRVVFVPHYPVSVLVRHWPGEPALIYHREMMDLTAEEINRVAANGMVWEDHFSVLAEADKRTTPEWLDRIATRSFEGQLSNRDRLSFTEDLRVRDMERVGQQASLYSEGDGFHAEYKSPVDGQRRVMGGCRATYSPGDVPDAIAVDSDSASESLAGDISSEHLVGNQRDHS